jgi:REP element-mobilizing transposase RayT
MSERFHRRSIRLRGYDYRQVGAYYVTVCTHERVHLFGQVTDGAMRNSPMGDIVQRCWYAIPEHMPHVDVGDFVVITDAVSGPSVPHGSSSDGGVGSANSPTLRIPDPFDDPIDAPKSNDADTPRRPPIAIMPKNSLGHIMQTFKSAVTRMAYRDGLIPRGSPIWQRNYYERIIRDDGEWARIAQYIHDNPAKWGKDRFNGQWCISR